MRRIIATLFLAAPLGAHAAASKLLLTEVATAPNQAEYVRIFNPGPATVDLTNYYLADYATYYQVVTSTAPLTSDFVVRFPAGATITPGTTQIVSVGGAECFKTACGSIGTFVGFGFYPDYELPPLVPTDGSASVPDMLVPFASAVGATRGLTNGGEPVVLFYWDGASNLVTDVDYVFYGTPTAGNPAVNKTGVMVSGSTYLNDTADDATHHAPLSALTTPQGTCRVVPFTEGTQTQIGGNGVGGSDETSENTATTWFACAPNPLPDGIFSDSFE